MKKHTIILLLISLILPFFIVYQSIWADGVISFIDHVHFFDPFKIYVSNKYVWNIANNGGYQVISNNLNVFLSSFQIILTNKLGFSDHLFSIVQIYLPLSLLFISYYLLLRYFVFRKSIYLPIIAAIIGTLSISTLILLSFGWSMNGIFPLACGFLSIYFFFMGLDYGWRYIFYAVIMNFFSAMLIQFFILSIVFIFIYLFITKEIGKNIKKLFIYLLLSLLINFSWISNYVINSFFFGNNYYSNFDLRSILIKNNDPLIYIKTLSLTNSGLHVSVSNFINRNFVYIASLSLTLLSFLASFFVNRNDNKKMVAFLFIYFLMIELSLGPNSFLYYLLAKYLPLFSIFRSYVKFSTYAYLCMFLMLSFLLKSIFMMKNKKISIFLTITIMLLSFYSSLPLFSGNLNGLMNTVNLPSDYYKFVNFYKENGNDEGVLVLPMPHWFSKFKWTDENSQITNPIKTLVSNYIYDEVSLSSFSYKQKTNVQLLQAPLTMSEDSFLKIVRELHVRYILIQNDQLNLMNSSVTNEEFSKNTKLFFDNLNIKKYNFGYLDLYDLHTNHIFIEENGLISTGQKSEKKENIRLNYEKVDQTKYKIEVSNLKELPIEIVFKENYNKGWELIPQNVNHNNLKISNTSIPGDTVNSWLIEGYDALESDILKLELAFIPQKIYVITRYVDLITILACLIAASLPLKRSY